MSSVPGLDNPLEKEMSTHSSILAWKIPWREEPGGLQSTGSQESDNDLETKPLTTTVDTAKGIWAIHSEPLRNEENSFQKCLYKSQEKAALIHWNSSSIGRRSLPKVWLLTVTMTDQTSSVGISEGPGAPCTDPGLNVWGTPGWVWVQVPLSITGEANTEVSHVVCAIVQSVSPFRLHHVLH